MFLTEINESVAKVDEFGFSITDSESHHETSK